MSNKNSVNLSTSSTSKPTLKRRLEMENSEASTSSILKQSHPGPSNEPEKNECRNKTASLSDLPNEILEKIFDQLSFDDFFNLEKVSKGFRDVVRKVAWCKIDTMDHEAIVRNTNYPLISTLDPLDETKRHKITNKSVKSVLSRANILHLDLSIYASTITSDVCKLLSMTPRLLSLDLSYIILTKNDLHEISRHCLNLEELSLESSFVDDETEEGLESIFTKCQNLKYLNLADNDGMEGGCFAYIPSSLLYIDLAKNDDLTFEAMEHLSTKAKNLETLIIQSPDYMEDFNGWLANKGTTRHTYGKILAANGR